jgi:ribosomal protein S30
MTQSWTMLYRVGKQEAEIENSVKSTSTFRLRNRSRYELRASAINSALAAAAIGEQLTSHMHLPSAPLRSPLMRVRSRHARPAFNR